MVPEGWERKKLSELFQFKNGLNADASKYGAGTKFVNVMDVFSSDVITQRSILGEVSVSSKSIENYRLEYGDVLFNRTSEVPEEIAFASVYLDDALSVFGGFVIRGRHLGNELSSLYCRYLFKNPAVRSEKIRRAQGAIRANIGQGDLGKVSVLLPPLAEQKKIAEILSTWDRAIEVAERQLVNAKAQKKALMQQLLTGKRRLPGFDGEWRTVKLGEVIEFLDSKRKPIKSEDRTKRKGPYPYYGATGIIDWVDEFLFDEPIILLGEDGENILSRRLPHAFIVREKCWVNNHAHVLLPKAGNNIDYLGAFLENLDYRKHNSGSAQPKLNKKTCEQIHILLPTFKEQLEIAEILVKSDQAIHLRHTQLSNLKSEKRALMQQLLTGKKRVKV